MNDFLLGLAGIEPEKYKADLAEKKARLDAEIAQQAETTRELNLKNQATQQGLEGNAEVQRLIPELMSANQNAKSYNMLSQIDLNGNGGDSTGTQQQTLSPEQIKTISDQANEKYPTLGGLAGQNVLGNKNLTADTAQAAGYSVPAGQPLSSDLTGTDTAKGIAQGAQQLQQGQDLSGLNRADAFAYMGGLKYLNSPLGTAVLKELQAQDTTEANNAEKLQSNTQFYQAKEDKIKAEAEAKREFNALRNDNKSLKIKEEDEQQQNRLEQQYMQNLQRGMKTQAYTLQNAKVEQAIHVRQAMESGRDENGNISINQLTQPEVALGLANLVSNKSTTNLAEFEAMQPKARVNYLKRAFGDFFGKPVDVLTPEWTNALLHMVDRQAATAEKLRDNTLTQYKKFSNSGLAQNRKSNAESVTAGTSYKDFFNIPDDDWNKLLTPSGRAAGGALATSQDSEAVKWAKANPGDPRAAQILKLNGVH